ncbi:MAG: hypothetical protein RJB45_748 [Pseudomonadota bacterium]|jgi:hypothetical protein
MEKEEFTPSRIRPKHKGHLAMALRLLTKEA